jgi:hypothetical protein
MNRKQSKVSAFQAAIFTSIALFPWRRRRTSNEIQKKFTDSRGENTKCAVTKELDPQFQKSGSSNFYLATFVP